MSCDHADRETVIPLAPEPVVTLAPSVEVRALACERAAALLRGSSSAPFSGARMPVDPAQVIQVARFILAAPPGQELPTEWPPTWPDGAPKDDAPGGEPA